MKVFLDDERQAPKGFTRTYTVAETIKLLETGEVTELSLDNDLGKMDSQQGFEVMNWIEEKVHCTDFVPPAKIWIHTCNVRAAKTMLQAGESIQRLREIEIERKEFWWLLAELMG